MHLLQRIDALLELDIVGRELRLEFEISYWKLGYGERNGRGNGKRTLSSAWPSCSRRNCPLRAANGEKLFEMFFPKFWILDMSMIGGLGGCLGGKLGLVGGSWRSMEWMTVAWRCGTPKKGGDEGPWRVLSC